MRDKKTEVKSGLMFKIGEKIAEKTGDLFSGLLDEVGGNLTEKAKRALMLKPRAALDYMLDNLGESLPKDMHVGNNALKRASDNIRRRLQLAKLGKARYTEDKTVDALLKYESLGETRCAKRLFQVGVMSDKEFWERIDTLVDEGIKQNLVTTKKKMVESTKKVKNGSVKFIKDKKGKVSEKLEKNKDNLETEDLDDDMPPWLKTAVQKSNNFKNG